MIEPSVVLAVFREMLSPGYIAAEPEDPEDEPVDVAARLSALPGEIAHWTSFLVDVEEQLQGEQGKEDGSEAELLSLRASVLAKLRAKERERKLLLEGGFSRSNVPEKPGDEQVSSEVAAGRIAHWEAFLADLEQTAAAEDEELRAQIRRKLTRMKGGSEATGAKKVDTVAVAKEIAFLRDYIRDLRQSEEDAKVSNDPTALRQIRTMLRETGQQLQTKLLSSARASGANEAEAAEIRAFLPFAGSGVRWREASPYEALGAYDALSSVDQRSVGPPESISVRIGQTSFYPSVLLLRFGRTANGGSGRLVFLLNPDQEDQAVALTKEVKSLYGLNRGGELVLTEANVGDYVAFVLAVVSGRVADDAGTSGAEAEILPVPALENEASAVGCGFEVGGFVYHGVFGVGVVDGEPGVVTPRDFRITAESPGGRETWGAN